ncbi:DUF692 family multinuclear iron-containing protein [Clostridium neuense]|uniref:DUF692 family multinuclear iron-containing protein n=1 Tax=Clostridium neuense TaxID=1728934 RepID=A0ABW8T8T7_9CLOT
MYIGCNWSKALKSLLENNAVKVDYVKSGAFGNFDKEFETMRSMRPVLLHGLGYFENTGMKNIEVIDFNRANKLIKKCNSPHYGVHLAIRNADMHEGMTDEEIYSLMSNHIRIFKDKLEVPLLLENSPDSPTDRTLFDLYPYTDASKISKIYIDNDVCFLLDISHTKITAKYNEWDIRDYLKRLPLDRIKEIHVNGSGYDKNGFPKDTHQAMQDEEYELLAWVLNYSKPDIVTLEYNGVEGENEELIIRNLEEQLNKINEICR